MPDPRDPESYLSPQSRYYGEFTPQHLLFNANLQEFSQRISMICALETGGKITPHEAYLQIKSLWKQLKTSKKELLDRPDQDDPRGMND
jgi:hypothetical protein